MRYGAPVEDSDPFQKDLVYEEIDLKKDTILRLLLKHFEKHPKVCLEVFLVTSGLFFIWFPLYPPLALPLSLLLLFCSLMSISVLSFANMGEKKKINRMKRISLDAAFHAGVKMGENVLGYGDRAVVDSSGGEGRRREASGEVGWEEEEEEAGRRGEVEREESSAGRRWGVGEGRGDGETRRR